MTSGGVRLPTTFTAFADRGPQWAEFVERAPRTLAALIDEWRLRPDGEPAHGRFALVVPVLTDDGTAAALKLGYVDEGSEHEALALQHWQGRGSVALLRAAPRRGALLLERLEQRDLGEEWDVAACEAVGALYGDLHIAPPPQLRRLSRLCERWASRLRGLPRSTPLPPRLVEQAAHLAAAFATDAATDARLLHGDLHYGNVLAQGDPHDEGQWLAIDPRPLAGDPHFEPAPLLWHRFDELAGDVRDGLRRRFHAVVDAAELDEDRARDWAVLRAVVAGIGGLEGGSIPLTARQDVWLTTCVAIAKAVQD